MNGFYFSNNDARVQQFQLLPTTNHGGTLRSHLSDNFGMTLGEIRQHSVFIRRVRQRLLAIHVFAHVHGAHGNGRVHVIRRGHGYRVKFISKFVKHLTPIREPLRLWKFRSIFFTPARIHIAKRDNVHVWMLG